MYQPPGHIARTQRSRSGFTMIEVMIVLVIVAIATAMAIPSMNKWSANQRLHDTARETATTLAFARGEALRTGAVHLVFFGGDTGFNPLVDPQGVVQDVLVVNDGLPGSADQNCLIDANEAVVGFSLPPQGDVQPAPSLAA
jgi:prepilin-type N-terminal cleavage/methylation domain-containing protein